MLRRYWFQVDRGLGYGVTALSVDDARGLLTKYGYPRSDERITGVIEDVAVDALDASHVMPNAGPLVIRGVWYPRHNL
ncbi:hypothetical protein SAMN05428982_0103 [Pseudoxanthomonas sp. CF385]|uniref:hypothetical protein n=1 Tax=Pseudoxanthomonas sp. CF385 TaxID=1881042 RepID=UPI000885DD95|nr:hypothetical protein [Pseudoxanthomonas sp. CF385]SDQ21001.1 hypothetical protein SAMN05428982_0103 [Pseudoxanthomonas sp. CF385]